MKKVRKVADLADLARVGKEHRGHVILIDKKQLVLVIWLYRWLLKSVDTRFRGNDSGGNGRY